MLCWFPQAWAGMYIPPFRICYRGFLKGWPSVRAAVSLGQAGGADWSYYDASRCLCRRPAIDDITGQAMTWTSGPSHASMDGLSSSAVLGQDMQLWRASTAFKQVHYSDVYHM